MKKTSIVIDKRFLEHETGPMHPEAPERLKGIIEALKKEKDQFPSVPPSPASREELGWVHTEDYLNLLESLKGKSSALDADTPISPRSVEVGQLAAGGGINLVHDIHSEKSINGFALVRPPGHHAEPDRGMGFCLYNNVAIAARYLSNALFYKRILIVDFDLHHGNGTQKAFYEDERVLYFSTHQYPYYPGTGHWSETGEGKGEGYNINLPLGGRQGNGDYLYIFEKILRPVALEFRPEFILVSAGYDIYYQDPLGTMNVTEEGFATMAAFLKNLGQECCSGKLAFFLEGGYHLEGLRDSVMATLRELRRDGLETISGGEILEDTMDSVEKAIAIHKKKWQSLA